MRRSLRDLLRGLNRLVRPVDELLAPRPWTGAPPLFLFGSARSGTTLAYQILAHAFNVTYLPRTVNLVPGLTHTCFRIFSARLYKPPSSLRSDRGRTPSLFDPSEGIGFWTPWLDERGQRTDALARNEATLARAVHRLQGHFRTPMIVKCVYLIQVANLLARALPQARFIHLSRAPVPAIASLYRARCQTAPNWWSLRPPGTARVLDLPLLDQCVWQHFAVDSMVTEALSNLDRERSRTLVYEDLCLDPARELETMRRWLVPLGWQAREGWVPPSLTVSNSVTLELEQRIRDSPEFCDA